MATRLTASEITAASAELADWQVTTSSLTRTFRFQNFAQALAFVNAVGERAEVAKHHPDIEIHWNQVRLDLTTHSAGGLTTLDFELAQAINALPAACMPR